MQDDPIIAPATGVVRGDSRAMPDRGTASGVTDTYGAALDPKAKNRRGSIDASSDPMFECCPPGDKGC